jgi:hypothetical protein
MPRAIGLDPPTNNGKVTRIRPAMRPDDNPLPELRRRSTDRPRSLEDSAYAVGTWVVILAAAIVMALVLL